MAQPLGLGLGLGTTRWMDGLAACETCQTRPRKRRDDGASPPASIVRICGAGNANVVELGRGIKQRTRGRGHAYDVTTYGELSTERTTRRVDYLPPFQVPTRLYITTYRTPRT
jgi:hypothetical protein